MSQKPKQTVEKSNIISPYVCKQETTIQILCEKVDQVADSVNKLVEIQLQQKDLEKEIAMLKQEQDTMRTWIYGLGIVLATAIVKLIFDLVM